MSDGGMTVIALIVSAHSIKLSKRVSTRVRLDEICPRESNYPLLILVRFACAVICRGRPQDDMIISRVHWPVDVLVLNGLRELFGFDWNVVAVAFFLLLLALVNDLVLFGWFVCVLESVWRVVSQVDPCIHCPTKGTIDLAESCSFLH